MCLVPRTDGLAMLGRRGLGPRPRGRPGLPVGIPLPGTLVHEVLPPRVFAQRAGPRLRAQGQPRPLPVPDGSVGLHAGQGACERTGCGTPLLSILQLSQALLLKYVCQFKPGIFPNLCYRNDVVGIQDDWRNSWCLPSLTKRTLLHSGFAFIRILYKRLMTSFGSAGKTPRGAGPRGTAVDAGAE